MPPYESFFKDKRVTNLGLGLLGRSVGDAAFIAAQGARVIVTDRKSADELQPSVARLEGISGVVLHLGGHDLEDFTNTDMVIKAAGVRLDSPEVAAARHAGVPVYMSTALAAQFAREAGATIVGVTGTRGKSTVTHMIHHVLVAAGKRAHLGGNIRGVSTLAMLPEMQRGDVLVLELDSWQLQGFGDLEISPSVAVFTNLQADHANYYPDEATYFADKAHIFAHQSTGDTLIVSEGVLARIQAARPPAAPQVAPALPDDWRITMPGAHNRENAAFAAQALRSLGLGEDDIRTGIESFSGVEGRLQLVREIDGVSIYNDNNATTPDATIAALNAFPEKKVVLIMGGADKGLPLDGLLVAAQRAKRVVFLEGTGTDRIKEVLPDIEVFSDTASALERARTLAKGGDIILFSPAFASFGMFKNEYDRNDQFMQVVQKI